MERNLKGALRFYNRQSPPEVINEIDRLRKEVDTFVTDAPELIIIEFAQSLRVITSWTLALIEVLLIRRFTKECILPLIEAYASINTDSEILLQRMTIYSSCCWFTT